MKFCTFFANRWNRNSPSVTKAWSNSWRECLGPISWPAPTPRPGPTPRRKMGMRLAHKTSSELTIMVINPQPPLFSGGTRPLPGMFFFSCQRGNCRTKNLQGATTPPSIFLKPSGLEDSGMEKYPSTKLADINFYYVQNSVKNSTQTLFLSQTPKNKQSLQRSGK